MAIREKTAFGGLALAILASCAASPRTEVMRGLMAIGFDERPAKCIAREMDEHLAPAQMDVVADVIRKARRASRENRSAMNVFASAMRIDDPSIPTVAIKAGAGCLLANETE